MKPSLDTLAAEAAWEAAVAAQDALGMANGPAAYEAHLAVVRAEKVWTLYADRDAHWAAEVAS
jgi:hypothetical protein